MLTEAIIADGISWEKVAAAYHKQIAKGESFKDLLDVLKFLVSRFKVPTRTSEFQNTMTSLLSDLEAGPAVELARWAASVGMQFKPETAVEALAADNFELSDVAFDNGVDIDVEVYNQSLLLTAISKHWSVAAVEYLINRGIDPNRDTSWRTCYIEKYLGAGIDPDVLIMLHGHNIIHLGIEFSGSPATERDIWQSAIERHRNTFQSEEAAHRVYDFLLQYFSGKAREDGRVLTFVPNNSNYRDWYVNWAAEKAPAEVFASYSEKPFDISHRALLALAKAVPVTPKNQKTFREIFFDVISDQENEPETFLLLEEIYNKAAIDLTAEIQYYSSIFDYIASRVLGNKATSYHYNWGKDRIMDCPSFPEPQKVAAAVQRFNFVINQGVQPGEDFATLIAEYLDVELIDYAILVSSEYDWVEIKTVLERFTDDYINRRADRYQKAKQHAQDVQEFINKFEKDHGAA